MLRLVGHGVVSETFGQSGTYKTPAFIVESEMGTTTLSSSRTQFAGFQKDSQIENLDGRNSNSLHGGLRPIKTAICALGHRSE